MFMNERIFSRKVELRHEFSLHIFVSLLKVLKLKGGKSSSWKGTMNCIDFDSDSSLTALKHHNFEMRQL